MSILRNSFGFGTAQRNAEPSLDIPVLEGYDTELEGHLIDMEESFEDQLAINESLYTLDMLEIGCKQDIKYLQESNQEHLIEARTKKFEVLQESAVKDAFARIKAMWQKMIAKLKAFFTTLSAKVGAITMDNKKFASKYSYVKGEVKVECYNYSPDKISETTGNLAGKVAKVITGLAEGKTIADYVKSAGVEKVKERQKYISDEKDTLLNGFRANLTGHKGDFVSGGDYGKLLFKAMRGGTGVKQERTITASDALQYLSATNALDGIKKSMKELPKVLEKELSGIMSLDKAFKDDEKELKTAAVSFVSTCTEISNTLRGFCMTYLQYAKAAANEEANLNKQVIVKLAAGSSKKTPDGKTK